MSHVVNYGSSVFEGIRCYALPSGPAIFRATEHMQRLLDSAKHLSHRRGLHPRRDRARHGRTGEHNGVWPCYIRPIVLRGYGEAGVNPFNSPTEVYIAIIPGGNIWEPTPAGSGRLRFFLDANCAQHSAGDGQVGRELHEFAAHQDGGHLNGYVEGIALDVNGYVSEGSGENVFIVRNGMLHTAPLGNSVLPGITRDSVLHIARDLGIKIVEQQIPRELLYIADEVFFTGTAAEITPIRSVDKISVGKGKFGPMTKSICKPSFIGIIRGEKGGPL